MKLKLFVLFWFVLIYFVLFNFLFYFLLLDPDQLLEMVGSEIYFVILEEYNKSVRIVSTLLQIIGYCGSLFGIYLFIYLLIYLIIF